jgi:CubicO group peptidase (beta-lactamase class C family)
MNDRRFSSPSTAAAFLAVAFLLNTGAQTPLPLGDARSLGFDPTRLERVHDLVRSEVEAGRIAGAGVLIARRGRIVDFRATGRRDLDSGAAMEKDTIVRIYSMTKVVTAVAALQLFEQNRFNLDSPVTTWLPELKDVQVFAGGTAEAPRLEPVRSPITVRMLLNHTAGFTYDFFAGSPVNELYQKQDLWNATSLDDFMARVGRLPLIAQPGTAYNYSISDDVLGVLIQRVSGMRFEDYIARHITGPLAMPDTAFDVPPGKLPRLARLHEIKDGKLRTTPEILGAYAESGRGIPCGGAGLFSTIGDYARFAQCLLNGGELDGARILGRKTLELARMNSLPAGVHAFSPSDAWGLFSAIRIDPAFAGEPLSEGSFFWSGAATTHFFVDPSEELVALVFAQHLPFDQHGMFTRFRTAVTQALR